MIGNLIIVSSPSGGGKGTLIREILQTTPDIMFSVSYTTRAMRGGEQDGREYFFVDVPKFKELIAAGEFLEYAEVHGNLYGTSLSQVKKLTESGKDVLLEVDVQGAKNMLERCPTPSASSFCRRHLQRLRRDSVCVRPNRAAIFRSGFAIHFKRFASSISSDSSS